MTHSWSGCTDLPDEEGTETVLAETARSFLGREKLSRTLRGMMQGDIRLLPGNRRATVKAHPQPASVLTEVESREV